MRSCIKKLNTGHKWIKNLKTNQNLEKDLTYLKKCVYKLSYSHEVLRLREFLNKLLLEIARM